MEGPERVTVIENRARSEADKPTWLRPYCRATVPRHTQQVGTN